MRHERRVLLAAVLLAGLIGASPAEAAPGALDPSFGTGGTVTTSFGEFADGHAVALQPDGKIVVAGVSSDSLSFSFAAARYGRDGSLDPSFGSGGKVVTGFGGTHEEANAVAIQPDGKIVLAGGTNSGIEPEFGLIRLRSDGSLDPSFNLGGRASRLIGVASEADALALQPDGKIIAAGGANISGHQNEFALVRFNPDGTSDSTFGDGVVTTAIGVNDGVAALALQPDGKIIAVGTTRFGGRPEFALARYNPDGSLDQSFGFGGKVITAFGTIQDEANAVVLQPDGKIVAGGETRIANAYQFAVARYNPDGSLDQSFGSGGQVTLSMGASGGVRALALEPDGKILAGGFAAQPSGAYEFALARYNLDGSLDSNFGSAGQLETGIGTIDDQIDGIALQPDGRFLAAGFSEDAIGDDGFALARYLGSTLTVTTAGSGAGTVSSSPAGIACSSLCSAPFASDATVSLTATPAPGSSFAGWSGDCTGNGACVVRLASDSSITATFESDKTLTIAETGNGAGLLGTAAFQQCVVPKLVGKSLARAKNALRRAHCRTGKVSRRYSSTVSKGRVLAQRPKPGRRLIGGSKVNLLVGRGQRPRA
jgi:uncharacterized delta-60 repeat protein